MNRLYFKTFQVFVQAPISPFSIMIGEVLAGMTKGLFASVLIMVVGFAVSAHFRITPLFVDDPSSQLLSLRVPRHRDGHARQVPRGYVDLLELLHPAHGLLQRHVLPRGQGADGHQVDHLYHAPHPYEHPHTVGAPRRAGRRVARRAARLRGGLFRVRVASHTGDTVSSKTGGTRNENSDRHVVVLSAALSEAARDLGIELSAYSTKQIKREPGLVARIACGDRQGRPRAALPDERRFLGRAGAGGPHVKDRVPVVVVGPEPSFCRPVERQPGDHGHGLPVYPLRRRRQHEEHARAILSSQLFGGTSAFESPEPLAWEGIHHPAIPGVFLDDGRFPRRLPGALPFEPASFVGLLYSRSNWVNRNLEVEGAHYPRSRRRRAWA